MPDEERWASSFDPDCVLTELRLDRSCREVVEFGCGYGLFTIAAARVAKGPVYALDIEPELVERTEANAEELPTNNVVGKVCDFISDGTGLPDESCDYAMLFNILHVEQPIHLLRETRRILRPGMRAGVIHWKYDASTPRGPSLDIRPKPSQIVEWAESVGSRTELFEDLACCPYHYGVTLTKP